MSTRRERVILELEDNFTADMARAAAATALLKSELNDLSGKSVQTSRDSDAVAKSIKKVGDEASTTDTKLRRSGQEIDRYSGRLRLITEAAVVLGPALVPISAVAVPAVMSLAAGLGAAAGALGVTLLAAQGLGDGLKALNKYQLEPTQANLVKMREEFDKIGPSGVVLVKMIDDLEPEFRRLQEVARAGLLPGVAAGLDALMPLLPQVRLLVFNIATEMGRLSAEAGHALSGAGFAAFFDYIATDAGPTLEAFGHTIGNVVQGFASLLVAFGPLSSDFAAGMEHMSASFAHWAAGLSQTEGFQNFVDYLRETGPQVIDLLGAMATAFIGILRAAAPVGAAVLPALTALARILGTIADSPIGPPLFTAVAALLAVNRAATLASAGFNKFKASADGASLSASKFSAGLSFTAIISGIGLVNAAFNKLDDQISGSDLNRNLEALSRGETVEGLTNIGNSLDIAGSKMARFNDVAGAVLTLNFDDSSWEKAKSDIEAVDQALAGMVEAGQKRVAARAFEEILKQAHAAGVSTEDATAAFDAYTTALGNAGPAADQAAAAQARYNAANKNSREVLKETRSAVDGLVTAMQEQRSAALGAFDAVTRYAEALDNARAQAKKTNAGIDATTEAGRMNRDMLSKVAAAWNNQGEAVRNNMTKWAQARKDFIQTAVAMGVPIAKAKELADKLLAIPKQRVIDIKTTGTDEAATRLENIRKAVTSIPREWSTRYYVTQVNAINKGGFEPNPDARGADGMTVPGPRHPYRDKILAYLAPGEEVISNRHGQADRFRADRAAGLIPGYANGGTAGFAGRVGGTPSFGLVGEVGSELTHLLFTLNGLGERELKRRAKLLDREESLAEKSLQQAKDRLDEERQQLQDLRDQRRQFMQQVTGNFRSDVFGGGADLEAAAKQGLLGPEFAQNLLQYIRDNHIELTPGSMLTDYAGQYIQTLTPQQIAALQAQASVGTLQQNSADAQAFEQVLQQLHDLGLTGGAFNQLAASGNLAQAQAYLQMGPDFIKTLMQDFRQRNDSLRNLGKYVGNERFGADIRDQLKETRRAVRVAEEQRDELRSIKQAQRDVVQRLDRIEKNSPKKTGDAVASAIGGAVSHGQKRGS